MGCDPDKIYESNVKIPASGWLNTDIARFEVEITDIESAYNVYVNVRNNHNYRYENLWLFVNLRSPFNAVERDTVRIILADHRGKWLGHGLGSKFDSRLLMRPSVRFPVTGIYIFEYEQASRDNPLIGIDDIGLRVEKVTE